MTPEEIRIRKKELGYTIKQLSGISGVSVGTLQKILNGETKSPRYETLKALDLALFPNTGHENNSNLLKENNVAYNACKKQNSYTISDYYAFPDERRVELIDGVIYDMGSPSFVHQRICSFIYTKIQQYLTENKLPCMPLFSPVDVRLDEDDKTMVQPDLLILCDKSKIRRWGIMGAPDFVLEVVSHSSVKRDYVLKVSKYINAGVKEFWVVDPIMNRLLIYYADPEHAPCISPLSGTKGIGIYNDQLEINLDEIADLITDYPD